MTSYGWETELPALAALSDDAAASAINAMVLTAVGAISKDAFAPLLATAIGRVFNPTFVGDKTYWSAILQLWTSLDAVRPADPHTQAVIGRAVTDGVLLQSEVDAMVAGAVVTTPKYLRTAAGEVHTAREKLS